MFTVVEFHSGQTVKVDATDEDHVIGTEPVLFESEEDAMAWMLEHLGPEAGKEYAPVRIEDLDDVP